MSLGQLSQVHAIASAAASGLDRQPDTPEVLSLRGASRLVLAGQTLDVATLPVRDSRGLPRLDYMMRFRNPSDFSLTDRGDGKYSYSVEARVRVKDPEKVRAFVRAVRIAETRR